jgi:hypothetical protein
MHGHAVAKCGDLLGKAVSGFLLQALDPAPQNGASSIVQTRDFFVR